MPVYSLSDLSELADVTPRTVRYYVAQGLLPKPTGFGPGAHYADEHLARLRLIRRLQREHLPLAEIRRRLEGLRDEAVERMTTGQAAAGPGGLVAEGPALDYLRDLLGGGHGAGAPPPTSAGALSAANASAGPLARAQTSRVEALASAMPLGASPRADAPRLMHRLASAPVDEGQMAAEDRPAIGHTTGRSQWDRIALSPDVEVHVRRPLSRHQNRQVDRLLEAGRQIFEEETR